MGHTVSTASRGRTRNELHSMRRRAIETGQVVVRGSTREQQRIWRAIGQDDPEVATFRGEDEDGVYLLIQARDNVFTHSGRIIS